MDEELKIQKKICVPEVNIKAKILNEILKCLKDRYEVNPTSWMTLEEILADTGLSEAVSHIIPWLKQALLNHHKIVQDTNNKYAFLGYYKVNSVDELLSRLNYHRIEGMGGIPLEDIHASWEGAIEEITKLVAEGEIVTYRSSFDGGICLTYSSDPVYQLLTHVPIQFQTADSLEQPGSSSQQ